MWRSLAIGGGVATITGTGGGGVEGGGTGISRIVAETSETYGTAAGGGLTGGAGAHGGGGGGGAPLGGARGQLGAPREAPGRGETRGVTAGLPVTGVSAAD